MKLITVEQAKKIDYETINTYGVPQGFLMEVAGKAVADETFLGTDKIYAVVCGKGNNGGDGCVCARHLYSMGADVTIVTPVPFDSESLKIAQSFGVPVTCDWETAIKRADIVVDAILGIGAQGEPKPPFDRVIDLINQKEYVVAVDVPTGVNADTGTVASSVVKAEKTVTFGFAKVGLMLYPARKYAGEIIVKEIGFMAKDLETNIYTTKEITLPEVQPDAHKFQKGSVAVVAGCEKYMGAPYLSAVSALRSGCGIVTLFHPTTENYTAICPELISVKCKSENGVFSFDAIPEILSGIEKAKAVVLGPGLSVTDSTRALVTEIIKNYKGTLVLDADGINVITPNILKEKTCEIIITPHIGEMERFLGTTVTDDLTGIAKKTADEYNVTVVLKSASTVVASPNSSIFVNTLGNPGMATAGSSDVLAGIIGGLCAGGFSPVESSVNGVLIHSIAGDRARDKKGEHYMNATDIIEEIRVK
ncbi:MAG: NAD(P)H-hydrate dehydratase [Clostridia bacterium]|nr:NAD(P)H-hydrate dehydratase [Clostridia bacterium]